MAGEWNVLAKARNDMADLLDGLSDEQLNSPSLCEEWTVADVAGHAVSVVEMSMPSLIAGSIKNRKDIDGYFAATAKDFSKMGAPALASSLRTNAGKKLMFFSEASMVNDTAVHLQDMRRPLGLSDSLDPEVLQVALDEAAREFAKKLDDETTPRLVATDTGWSWGAGPEVRGTAEALLMALNRRDVASELEGDGISLLPS